MAKSKVVKLVRIELSLNKDEAEYLRKLLQNYLGEVEEPAEHLEHRSAIWSELNNCLEIQ